MTCKLSVTLNKVALLRNQRALPYPSVLEAAKTVIAAGAAGITVHPRPDERHITRQDARELAVLLADFPEVEYNIEGNPFESDWLDLVKTLKPQQATLVPDSPDQATSDHGWSVDDVERLVPIVAELQALEIRVSLFMDADASAILEIAHTSADRIELYTEPYAQAYANGDASAQLALFRAAAETAQQANMGVNAGHDLHSENLATFYQAIPNLQEVSIGHAFIAEALWHGLSVTTRRYLDCLD